MTSIIKDSILLVAILLSSLAFFLFPQATHAQEAATSTPPKEAVVIARVNVYNCSMVEEGRNLNVACDFVNGGARQPDVRYSIRLVRKYGTDEVLFDERVYDEVLTLEAGATLNKAFTYTIPGSATGEMKVMLAVSNSEGLPLANRQLGFINPTALPNQVEITPESCYLTIVNETPQVKYSLRQGVDIKPDEVLIGHCYIKNLGTTPLSLTPNITTTKRNAFGAPLKHLDYTNPVLNLQPNEVKEYLFTVPKPTNPQAYDSNLSFTIDSQPASNQVGFHYVVAGASATVQNITTDRPSYKSGETANITVFWTGPASNFPGSRIGLTAETANLMVVSLNNPDGVECGRSSADLENQEVQLTVPVAINVDCSDPTIVVDILDKEGLLLGAKTIQGPVNPSTDKVLSAFFDSSWLHWLLGGVGLLLIIGMVIYLLRRRKSDPDDIPMTTPISIVFCLMVGLSILGLPSGDVQADTFVDVWDINGAAPPPEQPETITVCDEWGCFDVLMGGGGGGGTAPHTISTTFTVNIDKPSYVGGETIISSGTYSSSVCSNGGTLFGGNLNITNVPQSFTQYLAWQGSDESEIGVMKTADFTAPNAPGNNYTMRFLGKAGADFGTTNNGTIHNILYTVTGSSATADLKVNNSDGPVSVNANDTVSLSWTSSNASSCTASGSWVGSKSTGGSESQNVGTAQKTYTIDCGGVTDTVVVNVNATPTVDLKVNGTDGPISSAENENVTLAWTTTGSPASCTASNSWSGSKAAGGGSESANVGTTGSKTYTVTCGSASDSVTVNVSATPSPSVDLLINGGNSAVTVASGASVSLSWSSSNAASCTASGAWSGSKATSGSGSETVTGAETYTINCDGAVDSVTANVAAAATCSDGIQNQGETGVDTGGPCAVSGGTCGSTPLTCDAGAYSANPADTEDYFYWTCGTASCSYYAPPPPPLVVYAECPSDWINGLAPNVAYPVAAQSSGGLTDDVRYGFIWSGSIMANPSLVQEWAPASGYVPAGTRQEVAHTWATPGSYTVGVYVENTAGVRNINTCWVDIADVPAVSLLVNGQSGSFSDPVGVYNNEDFAVTWSSNQVDNCTLNGPGVNDPWGESVGPSGVRTVNESALSSWSNNIYEIECRSIAEPWRTYRDTVYVETGNRAPTAPVITEVTNHTSCAAPNKRFSVVSTDPDGDNIRFNLDWDNNSSPESNTSFAASGATQYICRSSSQTSQTFKVRAEDYGSWGWGGLTSSWTSHTITPPLPASATITATNCTIAQGGNSCTTNVSWTSANTTAPVSVRQNNTEFSTSANNGGGTTRTLPYGTNTFTFLHNGGTELTRRDIIASCPGSAPWNGTACMAIPDLTITTDRQIVRSGDQATITWNVTNPTGITCSVTGPGVNVPTATLPTSSVQTPAVTAKSVYELRCTDGTTVWKQTTVVETTGTIEET